MFVLCLICLKKSSFRYVQFEKKKHQKDFNLVQSAFSSMALPNFNQFCFGSGSMQVEQGFSQFWGH